jgi:hypothetical protein
MPYKANPILAYETGLIWQYLKNSLVYYCPLDNTNATGFNLRANQLSTYTVNGAIAGYASVTKPYKLSVMRPDGYMTWEPSPADPGSYNDGSCAGYNLLGNIHEKTGSDVGRFDGGVVFVLDTAFNSMTNWGPNQVWCNPATADGH